MNNVGATLAVALFNERHFDRSTQRLLRSSQ